ncbi:MAG: hypothetical protein OER92_03145, partial [Alphaproteobacteria bacterium]|nr:hypothetical protein [Alphaproteobacteria bacterium]
MASPRPLGGAHAHGVAIVVLGVLILTPDGLLTTLVSADLWTMLFWRGLLMGLALTVFSLIWRRRRDVTPRALFTLPTLGISLLFAGS